MSDFEDRNDAAKRDPRREWLEARTLKFADEPREWTWQPVTATRPLSEFSVAVFRGRIDSETLNRRIGDPFEDGA